MGVAALQATVRERVQEALVPVLFDRMHRLHQKWEWRNCPCSWCEEKRKNHAAMQFSSFYMSRYDRRIYNRAALAEKAKVVVSISKF